MSSKRIKGIIKWYSNKHFGFLLTDEDNREIFFHINDCAGFIPVEGDAIEFEMGLDRNSRPKATNIKSVSVGVGDEHAKQ